MPIQIAEAVRHVLLNKTVQIYPDELIVGNFTSRRVGGIIYPELGGVAALMEIFKFHKRKINPLSTSSEERWKLFSILPFWLTRWLPYAAFKSPIQKLAFAYRTLTAKEYQIYEAGGIAHLAPDHEKLIAIGTTGIVREVEQLEKQTTDPQKIQFYKAVKIAASALEEFGKRYAICAEKMANTEKNNQRKSELTEIAATCRNIPKNGANSFQEAVQSMLLAHIALFQESLGESLCPGRIDQILFPYYQKDIDNGRITRENAKEILAAFCIKLCETVPAHPEIVNKTLGGLPSYQVVTVGGVNEEDRTPNELSYILLELMDELRMRQPNFHVRLHENTPNDFYDEVIRINTGTGGAPAMYNDQIIIKTMCSAGYTLADARNYVAIGCVEPTSQGKTLGSTDAAIINLPLALEMALNQGKSFGSRLRIGAKTPPVSKMTSMDDVKAAYEIQVRHQMNKLIFELQAIEKANSALHPTPLTSMLIDGCLKNGRCSTSGGASYNFSGIQGVGISTVGDSLYAIEKRYLMNNSSTWKNLSASLKII
ncbi:MAG: pyruvate formate lyase family protein [Desulfobacterales bacterium]